MDVFDFRNRLVADYASFVQSFISIRDDRIRQEVHERMSEGLLWPDPLIQLNPCFEPGETIDELVDTGGLHGECRRIFRLKSEPPDAGRWVFNELDPVCPSLASRLVFRRPLRVMDRRRSLCAFLLHRPAVMMRHNMNVLLRHPHSPSYQRPYPL